MTLQAKVITTATALVTTTLISLATASPANAAFNICKNVNLKVQNNSAGTIRLFDLDYYDYGKRKWRSEPTTNRVLQPGDVFRDNRNLEKVNQAKTTVRAKYRKLKKNGRWDTSKYYYYDSGAKNCTKGTTFTVTIR